MTVDRSTTRPDAPLPSHSSASTPIRASIVSTATSLMQRTYAGGWSSARTNYELRTTNYGSSPISVHGAERRTAPVCKCGGRCRRTESAHTCAGRGELVRYCTPTVTNRTTGCPASGRSCDSGPIRCITLQPARTAPRSCDFPPPPPGATAHLPPPATFALRLLRLLRRSPCPRPFSGPSPFCVAASRESEKSPNYELRTANERLVSAESPSGLRPCAHLATDRGLATLALRGSAPRPPFVVRSSRSS